MDTQKIMVGIEIEQCFYRQNTNERKEVQLLERHLCGIDQDLIPTNGKHYE